MAAVHAVIGFEMPDDGLDGLTPPEQLSLLRAQALGLAPVAQIHKRSRGLDRTVLHQDRGLRWRNLTSVVASQGSRSSS